MPEMPEVETTRRDLESRVVGRAIADVWVADGSPQPQAPLSVDQFRDAVLGRRIERLDRRGKYLIAVLSGGVFLILHRRMTGNLVWHGGSGGSRGRESVLSDAAAPAMSGSRKSGVRSKGREHASANSSAPTGLSEYEMAEVAEVTAEPVPDTRAKPQARPGLPTPDSQRFLRAIITLDDGGELHWDDQRKFGTWTLTERLDEALPNLGPEPLEPSWSVENLTEALKGRQAPIKAVLLDQRRVAGVGNIYADESLHAAGIHPLRAAGSLSSDEVTRLHGSVRAVLEKAIRLQGSSRQNFRGGYGQRGTMQDEWRVYDRAGQPCLECGTMVVKLRAAGRGTHVCPACQPDRAVGSRQ